MFSEKDEDFPESLSHNVHVQTLMQLQKNKEKKGKGRNKN
jgi:hypothetical protein